LLCDEELEQMTGVVDKMARQGDKKRLEAKRLEEKERRAVAVLEVMARHPEWWVVNKVVEVVKGLDWMVGEMLV
jgi:hypothetical protein